MRPRPEGLGVLQTRLAEARAALDEARARQETGTAETAAAIVGAEAAARELAEQMAVAAQCERNLVENIATHEDMLAALKAGLASTRQAKETLEARAAAAGDGLGALRRRLDEEKDATAPLILARQREVEKLERRISIRTAYHPPALPALFIGTPAPTMSERFAAAHAAAAEQPQPPIAGAPGGELGAPPTPDELAPAESAAS